ncbi:MAG: hypothetical protein AAGA11_18395 [Pseudomonadota bacterium]
MSSAFRFSVPAGSRAGTGGATLAQLDSTVRRLAWAEGKQAVTHFALAGLFWGLLAACVAVVAVRLTGPPVTPTQALAICVVFGVALGAAIGWTKRRSPLSVAIVTDIRLNLKQRLSSAWELYERDPHSSQARDLAAQLQRVRTLVGHRVFPLSSRSGNADFCYPGVRWGRLVPIAALLLLLVSSLELTPSGSALETAIDPAVQREGAVLQAYSAALAQRAASEQLAASSEVAEDMGRLGRRMQGGSLSRDQAVTRLNDLRLDIRDASAELAAQTGGGQTGSTEALARARQQLEQAAQNALNGTPSASNALELSTLDRALDGTDINPEAFRRAMSAAEDGDTEPLESLLQTLRERQRSARDAEELERAYRRVQSSRDNLDDSAGSAESGQPGLGRSDSDDNARGEPGPGVMELEDRDASARVFRHAAQRGGHGTSPDARQSEVTDNGLDLDLPDIRASGTVTEGQDIVVQTRVQPTVNAVAGRARAVGLPQHQQLEAILANDTVPTHQKDYVKCYFLQLSRAVDATPRDTDPGR